MLSRSTPTLCVTSLTPLQILRNESKPAVELSAERDLTSFSRFTRSSVGEFLTVFAKTVAERTKPGQRQDVEEQSYTFHSYARSEGCCGIIISDHEYPKMVAHQLLSKVLDEFLSRYPRSAWESGNGEVPFPQLKEYIVKYQDPQAADSIMKVCDSTHLRSDVKERLIGRNRSKRSSTRQRLCCIRLSSRYWSEARRSTAWSPSQTDSARRVRCSIPRRRSRTAAAWSCETLAESKRDEIGRRYLRPRAGTRATRRMSSAEERRCEIETWIMR